MLCPRIRLAEHSSGEEALSLSCCSCILCKIGVVRHAAVGDGIVGRIFEVHRSNQWLSVCAKPCPIHDTELQSDSIRRLFAEKELSMAESRIYLQT